MADDWLSTGQAAKWLGITPAMLYRLVDAGRITPVKRGRLLKFDVDNLIAYVETQRIEPGTLSNLYPGGREASDRRVRGRSG
ncbi:MAG: helix-turn-helix domain-containing protein [Acidimicrobiia bacterium]|nr:helix-turn-helix domain-containing protein [Acidimicrobiia bacterium]